MSTTLIWLTRNIAGLHRPLRSSLHTCSTPSDQQMALYANANMAAGGGRSHMNQSYTAGPSCAGVARSTVETVVNFSTLRSAYPRLLVATFDVAICLDDHVHYANETPSRCQHQRRFPCLKQNVIM